MKPHAYQGDKRIRRPARECQLLSSESKAYFDYLNGSGGMLARGEGVCQWGNRNAVRAAINRPGGNPCEVVTFCGVDLVLVSPKANYLKRDRNSSSSNTNNKKVKRLQQQRHEGRNKKHTKGAGLWLRWHSSNKGRNRSNTNTARPNNTVTFHWLPFGCGPTSWLYVSLSSFVCVGRFLLLTTNPGKRPCC